ncbi:MAG: Holliday junction branch migration protein RuvA [Chloroflexota bacterium]
MIRLIRGEVVATSKDSLVIDIGHQGAGIGLQVHVPAPSAAKYRDGDTVTLQTYLQMREDALTLYGFESTDELDIFELLIGISGVGPKVALATLSTLSPDALRLALANDEPAVIARTPGVGKRTAQKIVLELKDKVSAPTDSLQSLAATTDADTEVMDALVALGYSVVEAQRSLQAIPSEVVGVEERLRFALAQFNS